MSSSGASLAGATDATVAALVTAPSTSRTAMDGRYSALDDAGLNALKHGAKGDNATDDTAAIQACIDAAAALVVGVTDVVLPAGTYLVSGTLNVKANVRLRGAGMGLSIIKSPAAAASAPLVRLAGATDVELTDLTVDCNGRANCIGVISDPTGGTGTRHAVRRCHILNATNNAARFIGNGLGWTFEGNLVENCTNGSAMFAPAAGVTKDLRVLNNTYVNVGTNVLQVGNSTINHTIIGVVCTGNVLRDFQQVGPNGPIPIEITWCDDVLIANNYVGPGGTRGISTGQNFDMTITGNSVRGQSAYGVENGGNQRFAITGNSFVDCATWMTETGTTPCADGVFSGNVCVGTGLTGAQAVDGIKLGGGSKRVRIVGNVFSDWQFVRAAIRVGETSLCEDITVDGNTFIANDANTPHQAVAVRKAIRSSVRNNYLIFKRNLVAGDDTNSLINFTMDALSADLTIEGNLIQYAGTVVGVNNAAGIGHGATGASTLPGVVIVRNRVKNGARGLWLNALGSADAVVQDNDTRTCANVDNLNAAIVFRRSGLVVEGTAAPAGATTTWRVGDRCVNSTPVVGSPKAWVCTVAGAPGTWVSEGNL